MGRNIIDASSILESSRGTPVVLACGYTDMRKCINGLSSIVENQFKLSPYQKAIFVFCNKQRNRLKILVWEDNGYCYI